MPSVCLKPSYPFDDVKFAVEGVTISAPTGIALVSIATPPKNREELTKRIKTAYGARVPKVGDSSLSADGNARFLGLQHGQMLLVFDYGGDDAGDVVSKKLGDIAYYTTQSDGWVILRLTGPAVTAVLERICMLDVNSAVFAIGNVTRTVMEHLGVVMLRESTDRFLLLSPRSSANSFLQAIVRPAI